MGDWTFFSNYGHVLFCLDRNSQSRLRDVALQVGITERAVQKIVKDLQDEGFISISKQGRCNRYRINKRKSLRHELESNCKVGKMLALTARSSKADKQEEDFPPEGLEQAKPPEPARQEEQARKEEQAQKEKTQGYEPVDTRQQGSLF